MSWMNDARKVQGDNFYDVQFYGFCPVQANGLTLDGKYYYFRARGNGVTLEIAEDEKAWEDGELIFKEGTQYGTSQFDAGYIPYQDALGFFNRWMDQYIRTLIPW